MLGGRKITATHAGELLRGLWPGAVHRGLGGWVVLSPVMRSCVLDKLIGGLSENGCYTMGYADDWLS